MTPKLSYKSNANFELFQCPQCRKELYPAQPDPSDDQEIIEDATPDSPAADEAPESDENSESSSDEGYENAESSSDEDSTDSSEDEQFDLDERLGEGEQFDDDAEFFDDRILEHMARLFPDQDVFDEVLDLAEPIAEAMKSLHHRYTDGYGLAAMAATSVFLASHLVHEPRSAVEVEREILQGYPLVSELYQRQYDVKEDLIDGLGLDMNTLAFPPLFPNSESSESSESDDDED